MSLTRYTGNTSVISELADAPALTAEQIKAKFDEADSSEKDYLNNTLLPEIEQLIASEKATLQGLINTLGTQIRAEITADILADNQAKYHVGKIVMETENINPATYLGFGTWQYWGSGKVPVGIDTSDSDFNESEKTGGEKTHILSINEMPVHSHTFQGVNDSTTVASQNGNYPVRIYQDKRSNWQGKASDNAGGGQAHNNLQPYITCYMWKRVS